MLASEKNRLHKTLDDAGVRLGNVVSDIGGVTSTEIIAGLIEGKSMDELLACTRGQLRNKKDDLRAELSGKLSARHLFLLKKLQAHIACIEKELCDIDDYNGRYFKLYPVLMPRGLLY